MNITLKPEQEQFIQNQLAQGRFPNAEAVINQALQLLQEKQREYEDWVEDVKVKVNEAAAELERGEGVPLIYLDSINPIPIEPGGNSSK